jgi:hypothetical protein
MGLRPRLSKLVFRLHLSRRSVRLRLTLLYGCLFLLSGAGLLAITYLLVQNALAGPMTTSEGSLPRSADGGVVHAPAGNGLPAQQVADLHQLLVQSAVALGIMAVVSIGLGWLVAGRVLKPLRVMTATTRRISERSLHERLALGGPDDELKGLSDTIDELLASSPRSGIRLPATVRRQRLPRVAHPAHAHPDHAPGRDPPAKTSSPHSWRTSSTTPSATTCHAETSRYSPPRKRAGPCCGSPSRSVTAPPFR